MKKATLALLYFGVIALIIFLADRGESQFIFTWIRSIPGGDKVGHFLLIGGLAFVANYSLSCREFNIGKKSFLLGSAAVLFLAVLEEFSQLFIRYRTFDLWDLTFDFLGIWILGRLSKRTAQKEAVAR